jgi:hypothetical protein
MTLLPEPLRARLLLNGAASRETDHVPAVKFFNPLGVGTWLITEMMADDDTLFGLCDLGEPELGCVSLAEIAAVRLPFGLSIERDLYFKTGFALSVWTAAARRTGSITAAATLLGVVTHRGGGWS